MVYRTVCAATLVLSALQLFNSGSARAAALPSFQLHYVPIGQQDHEVAIAVDGQGNVFVVSAVTSESSGFPAVRVTKTDAQGNITATFDFGEQSTPTAAVVDAQGNLVVAGTTTSQSFPATSKIVQAFSGSAAFVVKIDGQLQNIVAGTVLGGVQSLFSGYYFVASSSGGAVTVDPTGNVYLTGSTFAVDFPLSEGAYQGSLDALGLRGLPSPFIAGLSGDLSRLRFSTFLYGTYGGCYSTCAINYAQNSIGAIAVDSSGNVVVAGGTNASNFPTTPGVYSTDCECLQTNTEFGNYSVGFVSKISADGRALIWSTYFGLAIPAIALDASDNVLIGGHAGSGGYIAELNSDAKYLNFTSDFGNGSVNGIAVAQGEILIAGTGFVAAFAADGSSVDSFTSIPGTGGAISAASGSIGVLGSPDWFVSSASTGSPLLAIGDSADGLVSGTYTADELVSLYGSGIGPSTPLTAQPGATQLGEYQVLFNGAPGLISYASSGQINVMLPDAVESYPTLSVTVAGPHGSIDFPTIFTAALRPAVFLNPGTGFAVALNADGTFNSKSNPAAMGSIVTIWATGYGYQSPTVLTPLPVSILYTSLSVSVSGVRTAAGVLQVNFQVPYFNNQYTGSGGVQLLLSLQILNSVGRGFSIYAH